MKKWIFRGLKLAVMHIYMRDIRRAILRGWPGEIYRKIDDCKDAMAAIDSLEEDYQGHKRNEPAAHRAHASTN